MDISMVSMLLSQTNVQDQVGIQVMRKAMDTTEVQSQGLLNMMEQSVQPHLGGNMDIRI